MARPKKEKDDNKLLSAEGVLVEDRTDIPLLEDEKVEEVSDLNFAGFDMDAQKPNPNGRVWTKEELVAYHNKVIANSNKITLEDTNKACFNYCINTSGGFLIISDLEAKASNPESEIGITVSPGERINLETYFTRKAINRHRRHIIGAMQMKSQLYNFLPALLCVESLDVNLPFPVTPKSTMEKMKSKGLKIVEMPENEFDVKLREEIKKEEEYNARLVRRPGDGEKQMTQEQFEAQFA